jgi:hypothetical protein
MGSDHHWIKSPLNVAAWRAPSQPPQLDVLGNLGAVEFAFDIEHNAPSVF